jgi:hypothetical protein
MRSAACSVHEALVDRLAEWGDRDVADFARLVARFNDRPGECQVLPMRAPSE